MERTINLELSKQVTCGAAQIREESDKELKLWIFTKMNIGGYTEDEMDAVYAIAQNHADHKALFGDKLNAINLENICTFVKETEAIYTNCEKDFICDTIVKVASSFIDNRNKNLGSFIHQLDAILGVHTETEILTDDDHDELGATAGKDISTAMKSGLEFMIENIIQRFKSNTNDANAVGNFCKELVNLPKAIGNDIETDLRRVLAQIADVEAIDKAMDEFHNALHESSDGIMNGLLCALPDEYKEVIKTIYKQTKDAIANTNTESVPQLNTTENGAAFSTTEIPVMQPLTPEQEMMNNQMLIANQQLIARQQQEFAIQSAQSLSNQLAQLHAMQEEQNTMQQVVNSNMQGSIPSYLLRNNNVIENQVEDSNDYIQNIDIEIPAVNGAITPTVNASQNEVYERLVKNKRRGKKRNKNK